MTRLRVEMLVIGDELLDGRVTDSNSVLVAAGLAERGLSLSRRATVTDDVDAIVEEARAIVARGTGLCIVSGGLGPTADDITASALAELAGVELQRDEEQVQAIADRLQQSGRSLTENQRKQADRPAGAEVVPNLRGTAPGIALVHEGCRFVALPGVPHELAGMVAPAVFDGLGASATKRRTHTLRTFGLVEAEVDARLIAVRRRSAGVRFGFRARFPEIHVTLKADAEDAAAFAAAVEASREALGRVVFTECDESFATVVLRALRQQHATLATAESCTGGLIGDELTNVPGASDVYLLGVVSYANAAKEEVLGVPAEVLAKHGPVSEPTVLQMAQGVRAAIGSTHGLAVTGIAGPTGGGPELPVGTIWIGVVGDGLQKTRKLQLPFNRRGNKVVAAYAALDLLRRQL